MRNGDDSAQKQKSCTPNEAVVAGSIVTVSGYPARVKRVAEREDGVLHAIVRQVASDHDEVVHLDPESNTWAIGKAARVLTDSRIPS